MAKVVSVRKAVLNKRNIPDFKRWDKLPNTVYIGRNMSYYVPGATKSKWANPFTVKKYGLERCLELYEKHLYDSGLINDIEELRGKELGCWCAPKKCHGDILAKLLSSKRD